MPVDLAVSVRGSGPRGVLLLHGLGSRAADLAAVADALGPGWRAILPDLRGHGDSPARPRPQALADVAADLDGLLDDGEPVLVAGFSFGARVALELWRRRPAAVEAVALVDPMLRWGPLLKWAGAGERSPRATRRRLTALYRTRTLRSAERQMREHPLTRSLSDADRERNARALLAADRGTLRRIADWELPDPATMRPDGIRTPVLVLHGAQSPVCPADRAAALAAALGGEARSVPGGHCAQFEAPQAVAAALRALAP